MKKILILTATLALTLCVLAQESINVNPNPNGEPWLVGKLRELTPEDYTRIASTPKLTLSAAQHNRDLPVSIDNTIYPWFRPVFNQDGGSCGQASGIGYNFTYEMDYLGGLAANTQETQYPTHYTWNFLNGGTGGGSWYFDGWQIIAANGCPNVQTYGGTPWYGGDRRWMSGYDNFLSGMNNRMLEVLTIDVSSVEGLQTLKQWMYDRLDGSPSGGLANFSAGVSDVFSMSYLPAGTPNAGKQVVTQWGYEVNHAMTFVGFDDDIRYDFNNDGQYTNTLDITGDAIVDLRDWEIGGVIMVNSWGSSFGDNGKAYVMYRTLALSVAEGGIWNNMLHVIRTRTDYSPQINLKAIVKHTSRNKIKISAGVSSNTNDVKPAHVLEFPMFSYQGGDFYMQGGYSEADKSLEMGLDITPLLSYIEPGQQARFFIQLEEQDPGNSSAGQITSLFLTQPEQSMEYSSQMANVPILNNDTTWMWVDVSLDFIPAEITTQELPVAQAGLPYSYQLEAAGAPAPYEWTIIQQYTESDNQAEYPAITSNSLVPNNYDDGFATQSIDFAFPFYGESYQDLVITTDGSIAFDGQFEYIRSEAALKAAKAITPYGADLMIYPEYNDGIFYEGDATHATFRWKISKFENPSFDNDFAVTLYPNGNITFHYGSGITPASDWAAGISAGDGQNYLVAAISGSLGIVANSSSLFQCPPLPSGMQLSSEGIFSGVPTEPNGEWNISFKATSANSLFDIKTLPFKTASQLLIEPDTLIFEDDDQAYSGKYFTITNATTADVVITDFETYGIIQLQDGQWGWETGFGNSLPYTIAPGEELEVMVRLEIHIFREPMTSYAIDTLNFSTSSENYQVILMFNDTINILTGTHLPTVAETGLTIAPNPAKEITTFSFDADASGSADMHLFNSAGKLVCHEHYTDLTTGKNIYQLNTNMLKPGLYLVKISLANRTYSSRLMIR
ncbi:MAG: T9SS type A sorting domain-containing protein [Lentimicrobium sp.]|nr:T9SS type A sorting domain-containing protein [Lentimicrobium sp.]